MSEQTKPSLVDRFLPFLKRKAPVDLGAAWVEQIGEAGRLTGEITTKLQHPELASRWEKFKIVQLGGNARNAAMARLLKDGELSSEAKQEGTALAQLYKDRDRAIGTASSIRQRIGKDFRDHNPLEFSSLNHAMQELEKAAEHINPARKDADTVVKDLRMVAGHLTGKVHALRLAPRDQPVPFRQSAHAPTPNKNLLAIEGAHDPRWQEYRVLKGEHEAIRDLVGRHAPPLHQPSEEAMPPHPPMTEIEPLDIPAAAPIHEHGTPGARGSSEAGYHELLAGLDPKIQDQVAARLKKKGLPVPPALTREIEVVEQSIEHKPRSIGGMVIGGIVAAAALIGGWALAHDAKQSERNPYTGR